MYVLLGSSLKLNHESCRSEYHLPKAPACSRQGLPGPPPREPEAAPGELRLELAQQGLSELRLEHAVREQSVNQFVIGAFAEGMLIGICTFVDVSPFSLERTGNLIQMYVREAFRGQGIGLALAKATINEAFRLPHIERVVLEVNPQLEAPMRVYESAGFRVYEGERPPSDNPGKLMVIHKAP